AGPGTEGEESVPSGTAAPALTSASSARAATEATPSGKDASAGERQKVPAVTAQASVRRDATGGAMTFTIHPTREMRWNALATSGIEARVTAALAAETPRRASRTCSPPRLQSPGGTASR